MWLYPADSAGHGGSGHHAHSHATGHGAGGPASKRIVVGYGFWIYLISDIIMFSALFATYAVLAPATAGGPSAKQLFDPNSVAIETACLLASSFACGMASIAVSQRSMKWTQISLVITGLLGLVFLLLELHEFHGLVARGFGPTRSAFLSAFFTPGGLSWNPHHRRPPVARHDDGAVLCQGFPARHPVPLPVLQPLLARPGHHLGSHLQSRLPRGDESMSVEGDLAPGYEAEDGEGAEGIRKGVQSYCWGLALAVALTLASFWVARTHILYGPSVPVALVALAVAQMGIHLVFFLHITTAPDNTNNVLALAFGVFFVFVLIFAHPSGSWRT